MTTRSDADRRPGLTVALACVGVYVMVLDITIVSVALPRIGADLRVGVSALPWVVNAYTIALAGVLLVCGRLISNHGPAICYVIGTAAFGVASLACGVAPDFGVLVAARAVQGLAAALVLPATITLITTTYPAGRARAKALGMWSAVGAIGGSSGTTAGGVLTQFAGWRWIFLVNVPITGVLAVLSLRFLVRKRTGESQRQPLDLVGSALAVVGLAALVYGVLDSATAGWTSAHVLGCLVIAVVALAGFWLHQSRWARDPLVPPGLFSSGRVAVANASMFLLGLGFFASAVVVSSYLQDVEHWSPLKAGLALVPTPAGMFGGAQLSGRLLHRFGVRVLAATGSLFVLAGFVGLTRLSTQPGYWPTVAIPLALIGFGAGVAFTPITTSANDVPAAVAGVAAGLLNTTRQVATALGLSVLSAVAVAVEDRPDGYARAFVVAAIAAGAAVLATAIWLPGRARPSSAPSGTTEAEVALLTGALVPDGDQDG